MKLLVTGAGGFVGGAVAAEAARRGHSVVGLVRNTPAMALPQSVRSIALDLHDLGAVNEVLAAERPDFIVHAAWSGVARHAEQSAACALSDVKVAVTLVEAGARYGLRRFVGLGSQAEYGAIEGPIVEDRPLVPEGWYGAAKVAAYFLARQRCSQDGVSLAWARLFSAYGPGDRPTWLIPTVIAEICAGRSPRTTSGRQLWDYLFIDDAAAALVALAEATDAIGPFNLGYGQAVSVRSIIETIRDEVAPELDLVFGEIPHKANQIWHMEASISKLQAATGWSPIVGIKAGLARTIDAYRRTH